MNAFTRATDAISGMLPSVLPFRGQKPKRVPRISPLAIVDPRATLADDVEIGPFCIIGPEVTLGPGNKLIGHVVVAGHTTIGKNNVFYPNSVIGAQPQDLKFKGETSYLEIGDNNQIREAVTIHLGTEGGGGVTRVGNDNLLMVNAHIGHDSTVGDRCILANNVMLAGHIVLGNNVVLNGGVGVTAFVTIGDFAYAAGYSQINHDVPPFMKVSDRDRVRALNTIGLRRGSVSETDIAALEEAARHLFGSRRPIATALQDLAANNGSLNPRVRQLIDFLHRRDQGKHGRYLESLRR
jgi:UDP-N-acetylglucosamine acyltransferase